MRYSTLGLGALLLAAATPAFAQDAEAPEEASPPITVTGGVTLVSDYRFRGATQTDEGPAVQGTVNLNHESGLYAGVFASSIDGSGKTPALTGYGDVEIDFYAGYTKTLDSGVGFDVGLLYYYYADAASGLNTDFFEPYAAVTYSVGPVSGKVGAAYAWGGQAGLDFTASNDDNLYVYGDLATAIPSTPLTLKGHLGYSNGSLALLNPVGTDESYYDWSVSLEAVGGPFKVGVTYMDTDIDNAGGFAQRLGRGSTVLGYIGFSF